MPHPTANSTLDYQIETPRPHWALVMIAGFLIPGAGQFLRGERTRGLVIGIAVFLLFTLGLLIGGVRVVEFPTFPPLGNPVSRLLTGVLSQISFIPQFFMGPLTFIAGFAARSAAANPLTTGMMAHGRLADIAAIYTGVAGALNLLAIIDATARAADNQPPRDLPVRPARPLSTDISPEAA